MRSIHALALGLLVSSVMLASGATGAQVQVEYEIQAGAGFVGWGVSSTTGIGVAGGELVVVYDDGSPSVGGVLGTMATIQHFLVEFTSSGTLAGDPVPQIAIANGVAGSLSVGGFWNFIGATAIAASAIGAGTPTFGQVGTAFLVVSVGGPSTLTLGGAGTQMFTGPALTGSWTLGGIVAMEVSRVLVPEPSGRALLWAAGWVGLAVLAAGRSRNWGTARPVRDRVSSSDRRPRVGTRT